MSNEPLISAEVLLREPAGAAAEKVAGKLEELNHAMDELRCLGFRALRVL
ncbi:MAG: hypothetical protein H0T57_00600 [Rubrobacter sp.]|nr:hypothetical protein [Rubrobacter sp.]MDQ3638706.1 hypothetical protein [Actinomycetota bacterium]